MHWLRSVDGPTDEFNQTMVVQAPVSATEDDVEVLLQGLLDRHAMLRLSVAGDGTVTTGEVGSVHAARCVHTVDEISEAALAEARSRLDPGTGAVLTALWDAAAGRLALIVHHLAVDAVSWRILLEDLNTAWARHRDGRSVVLPVTGTSFATWAGLLTPHAESPALTESIEIWREILAAAPALPPPDPEVDTYAGAGSLTTTLDPHATARLLTDVPTAFHTGTADILLIALALVCTEFTGTTQTIGIDVEGHGRAEHLTPGLDLSRTVGWFTTKHPVALSTHGLDWTQVATGDPALGRITKHAKEQIRSLPDGLTYGLLRHLTTDSGLTAAEPTIGFNYLGRLDAITATGNLEDLWHPSADSITLAAAAAAIPMPLGHSLELTVATLDTGAGAQLSATWTWARSILTDDEIGHLTHLWHHALAGIVTHVADGGGGLTPSDITPTTLTQPEIDTLHRELRLADILPLTPMQQGLLFHANSATAGSDDDDVYAMQLELTVKGPLEPPLLGDAVNAVVTRHPNLAARFRTHFDQPVQLIPADPTVPYRYVDLYEDHSDRGRHGSTYGTEQPARQTISGTSARAVAADPDTVEAQIRQLCAAERAAVCDLAEGPSFRVAVIRTAPDQHRVVLTNHHIVVDGWSLPILARDLFASYYGHRLPAAGSFRRFVEWLADRDDTAARAAWRDVLDGFDTPTLVGAPDRLGLGPRATTSFRVSRRTTGALSELARSCHTTVNTVLQAAWAQLLMWLTGQHDVVFGTAVSGRPTDVPGAESMVGLLINTVPVRARITADTTIADLLAQLQDAHTRTLDHQHLALSEIHRATGHRWLFDTIFVYENYPLDTAALFGGKLAVTEIATREFNHYPLAMIAQPGEELGLRIEFDTGMFEPHSIEALTRRFKRVLNGLTAVSGRSS